MKKLLAIIAILSVTLIGLVYYIHSSSHINQLGNYLELEHIKTCYIVNWKNIEYSLGFYAPIDPYIVNVVDEEGNHYK